MNEYKFGNAIVRIQGEYDKDKLKRATADFLKKAEEQRRKKRLKAEKTPPESNAS